MGNELQLPIESIPAHVVVTTPSGEVETVNQPTLEYFGKTLEELNGWKTSDLVHPDDLQHTIAVQQKGFETGRAHNVECRQRRADGVYRWFNVLGLPLIDTDGRILRWFRLISDIDDRKRAEEALRASEINHWMVLRRPSEPAGITGDVGFGTISLRKRGGEPLSYVVAVEYFYVCNRT